MNITNQHQPYIFKNQNNEINIIVSEFMGVGPSFEYGDYISSEDRWQLHLLDHNFDKTIINTPETLIYNGITYDVIAECNGYIENNKISYIIGGLDKLNSLYDYYLVSGNFNTITNTVSNLEVLGKYRTGFYKQNDIYTVLNHKIIKNNLPLNIDFYPYLSLIVRIIPVYGHNKILVTGIDLTGNDNITLLYDVDSNTLNLLSTPETNNIYKSSIYDLDNIKMIAYTDKAFSTNNNNNNGRFELTQATYDYNLMIDSNFVLNEI